jgi:hypothetical protein
VNTNIMAGSKFEFLNRPSVVRVYAALDTGDAATIDFSLGNVTVGEDLQPVITAAGAGPNRNEHLLVQGSGAPPDRIQIRVRETSGVAAAVYRVLVEIVELA